MAVRSLLIEELLTLPVFASIFFIILTSASIYLFRKPPFPTNAPKLSSESWPLLGSSQFFTQRWDFCRRQIARSHSGNFSFYAGQWPVVALGGEEGKRVFFESKELGFAEGYTTLLGGSPPNPNAEGQDDANFSQYFNKRLINMVKGNRLAEGLPQMLKDVRGMLDGLAANPTQLTDPFDSIYKMVFKVTMRMLACNEIANDDVLLYKTLSLFEDVEAAATPLAIMFPWLPVPAKVKKLYGGIRLYFIFKRVVDERHRQGERGTDALQYLIDQGDSIQDIISFVLGALFAGQLNSGVNAAWVLVYLANKPFWLDRVRDEIKAVADRYAPDRSQPLKERLMHVPEEAWENEFTIINMCLKDSIRLQLSGTAFRKNVSGRDIPLDSAGSEVIPKDAYVAFPTGDVHYNSEIFDDPDEWDPSRYMSDRAEDQRRQYGWFGWGVARHPCLGMRFAKLEIHLIVAFFIAYFDEIQVTDKNGTPTSKLPKVNRNNFTSKCPKERVYLKYKLREEDKAN